MNALSTIFGVLDLSVGSLADGIEIIADLMESDTL